MTLAINPETDVLIRRQDTETQRRKPRNVGNAVSSRGFPGASDAGGGEGRDLL